MALIYVQVYLGDFQGFDHGGEAKVSVPEGESISRGDRVRWECAQFDGLAEVTAVNDDGTCMIRKIS